MAHKWYAIQTYSGSELSVKKAMLKLADEMADDRIAEVLVPTEDLIEVKKGKKTIIERPLYPAYAFAKIDLDTALWHRIQSMPKVGRFIGESKKPTALSDKDINLILEKAKNVYVIPADLGWSDLGTWTSVYENSDKNEDNNSIDSKSVLTYNAKNNIVRLKKGKAAIIDGLEDYIIVDTDKALLICPRENDQMIKDYVLDLKNFKKGEKYI